jgi:hypothetical protein
MVVTEDAEGSEGEVGGRGRGRDREFEGRWVWQGRWVVSERREERDKGCRGEFVWVGRIREKERERDGEISDSALGALLGRPNSREPEA